MHPCNLLQSLRKHEASGFKIAPLPFLYVSEKRVRKWCVRPGCSGIHRDLLFVEPQFSVGITCMLIVCCRAGFAPLQLELSPVLTAENHFILRQPAKFSKHTCYRNCYQFYLQ